MKPEKKAKVQPQPPDTAKHKGGEVAMHDLLGDKLRAYYNEVASEPVPDRFTLLLKELEAKGRSEKPD